MSRYETYFLMKEPDIEGYIAEKLNFFDEGARLESKEIGDGNINYVFRLKDLDSGKSVIVKQAGETLRISDQMRISTDRGRIEADILRIQRKYVGDLVPEVYLYDTTMCAIVMEDMVGYTLMRTGLINHEIYPLFADHISTFMVNTLLNTTDVVMCHKEKKEYVKQFINPELCEISEDLVYSEPFMDYNNRNNVYPPMADFVQKELYDDKALHLEVAKCKFDFMNNAQALIHGDLHTGSIFINQEHTYIFDPEFAFYGPIGYDVGNVLANMFFAWCNGDATIEEVAKKKEFCDWTIDTIVSVTDQFISKFKVAFKEKATERMAKVDGFLEWYLGKILEDTAAVTGMELVRRTVGMANVKDITSIADEKKRVRAEKIIITLAKDCIMNRKDFVDGKAYRVAIERAIAKWS